MSIDGFYYPGEGAQNELDELKEQFAAVPKCLRGEHEGDRNSAMRDFPRYEDVTLICKHCRCLYVPKE